MTHRVTIRKEEGPFRPSLAVLVVVGGIVAAAAALGAGPAAAQPTVRIAEADAVPVADVRGGRAVAVDPSGMVYVAEAGRDAVRMYRADGALARTLGGPGTDPGAFDGPSDVDPTNGLTLLVADAGNGRLQRFSEGLRFMEALPVGRGDGGRPVFDGGAGGQSSRGDGRPVAVAVSRSDETFAVDARQGAVLKWDARRRLETLIGGFDEQAGALSEPVDVAVSNDRLFVADRGAQAVKAYDLFGTYVRSIRPGPLGDVQALAFANDRLYVVCSKRVDVTTPDGRLRRRLTIDLSEPLVDAAPAAGRLYLLTETRLLHAPLP
jgi:hypothetical protein